MTTPSPSDPTGATLENLSYESRSFPPSAEFAAQANVKADAYAEAAADRPAFWAKQAERLSWSTPWTQVLDWSNPPFAKWFVGGTLNVAYNCLDRHVEAGLGDRVAYYFEGEPGDTRTITYQQLKDSVCQAANALTDLGVKAGDRVAIYMPMIPEAAVAMLACARIGAVHSVVFAAFSPEALRARIEDAGAKLLITADGYHRRGGKVDLKANADEAAAASPTIENVLVVKRTGADSAWTGGRDVWWHEIVGRQSTEHAPEAFDSENPLFILYTSGTTGKPKGILHTTGGYLTQTSYTHHAVFDLKPETDVYWCTADVGWVTGHSYIVYGPLANGVTEVMYEGTPDTPHQGRFWEIIQKYGVTLLYTAPTAIRMFMKWGDDIPAKFDLSSLRVCMTGGSSMPVEVLRGFEDAFGAIVLEGYGLSETSPVASCNHPDMERKPGSIGTPIEGVEMRIVDENDAELPRGEVGEIVIRGHNIMKGYWGRPDATAEAMRGGWFHSGDLGKVDEDGYFYVVDRKKDMIIRSGYNVYPREVEELLYEHPAIREAAVLAVPHPEWGEEVGAAVVLEPGEEVAPEEISAWVRERIAAYKYPRVVWFLDELPKGPTGKIVKREIEVPVASRP